MGEVLVQEKINMATQDTTTDTFLQYFTDATSVAEEKTVNIQFVIAKENQGYRGSKACSNSYSIITDSLGTKFGATKPFIANICDGKDNGNTKISRDQQVIIHRGDRGERETRRVNLSDMW